MVLMKATDLPHTIITTTTNIIIINIIKKMVRIHCAPTPNHRFYTFIARTKLVKFHTNEFVNIFFSCFHCTRCFSQLFQSKNFIFLFCFAFIVFVCSPKNIIFKHLAACIHVIKNTHAYKHMTKLSFPKSNIQIAHIFRLFRASRCNCSTMSRCAIHLMYACIIRFALFKRFRNSIVSHCIP